MTKQIFNYYKTDFSLEISKVEKVGKIYIYTQMTTNCTFRLHLYSCNSAVTGGATDHKTYGLLDSIMV